MEEHVPPLLPPRQRFKRKFLVIKSKLPKKLPGPTPILQGYLYTKIPVVRIRTFHGFLATMEIKTGQHFQSTPMRFPHTEAQWLLMKECDGYIIHKSRYELPFREALTWEVDVYLTENSPLMLVGIEIPTEDFMLDPDMFPEWVGREVTGQADFTDEHLALQPFSLWEVTKRTDTIREILM